MTLAALARNVEWHFEACVIDDGVLHSRDEVIAGSGLTRAPDRGSLSIEIRLHSRRRENS